MTMFNDDVTSISGPFVIFIARERETRVSTSVQIQLNVGCVGYNIIANIDRFNVMGFL